LPSVPVPTQHRSKSTWSNWSRRTSCSDRTVST
jgi:hypothetical protein